MVFREVPHLHGPGAHPARGLLGLVCTPAPSTEVCAHVAGHAVPGRAGQAHVCSPFLPQDLAWAISYYVRFFCTYVPFHGILGSLLFLNFIRCHSLAA